MQRHVEDLSRAVEQRHLDPRLSEAVVADLLVQLRHQAGRRAQVLAHDQRRQIAVDRRLDRLDAVAAPPGAAGRDGLPEPRYPVLGQYLATTADLKVGAKRKSSG